MFNGFSMDRMGRLFREKADVYLTKIKAALAEETEQTQTMLDIYQRFTQGRAAEAELQEANRQFVELLKSIGLGFLVILPFSPITIPAVVQLGKKYGIEVLPRSVRKQMEDPPS